MPSLTPHEVERLDSPRSDTRSASVKGLHLRGLWRRPRGHASGFFGSSWARSAATSVSDSIPRSRWSRRRIAARQKRSELLGEAAPLSERARAAVARSRRVRRGTGETRPGHLPHRQQPTPRAAEAGDLCPSGGRPTSRFIQPGWKHPLHAEQWRRSLELHAFPKIGQLSVLTIGIAEVLAVLEPIWLSRQRRRRRCAAGSS